MKNESCLRHRTVESVNNEKNGVNHLKNTLYLTAEVSVAGSIYDIDADSLVIDSGILGEDRDTSLTLKIVAVHNLFYDSLIFTVNACLLKHGVYDCCLSVVYVGNDCDVSQVLDSCDCHKKSP